MIVTSLASNLLLHHGDGPVRILPANQPDRTLFLGTPEVAKETCRAILAALGEPVEEKPDRSELDGVERFRWSTVDECGLSVAAYQANRSHLSARSQSQSARSCALIKWLIRQATEPIPMRPWVYFIGVSVIWAMGYWAGTYQ